MASDKFLPYSIRVPASLKRRIERLVYMKKMTDSFVPNLVRMTIEVVIQEIEVSGKSNLYNVIGSQYRQLNPAASTEEHSNLIVNTSLTNDMEQKTAEPRGVDPIEKAPANPSDDPFGWIGIADSVCDAVQSDNNE